MRSSSTSRRAARNTASARRSTAPALRRSISISGITRPAGRASSSIRARALPRTSNRSDRVTPPAPAIDSGVFHAYFLFDVADTIDLAMVSAIAGDSAQRAPLRTRAVPSPGRIQFAVPPLSMSLPQVEIGGRVGSARAKIFDYGVISIRLSFAHRGAWIDFATVASALRSDDAALAYAERALATVLADFAGALDDPHAPLVEDYYIHTVESFAEPVEAATLLGERGPDLVALLTADARPLGAEELRESLRSHFTYYPDDLVVVLWDSAFVYDDAADARVIEDILEFANSQLVEFRTYDARLDAELD